MKEKFRHEDHNRQDKTRKDGYRGDFIEESWSKASPDRLKQFKHFLESHKAISEIKEAFKTQLMRQYYDGQFTIGNRHFRLRWSFKDYWANSQVKNISNKHWKEQRKTAGHDLDIILEAINKTSPCNMQADQEAGGFMLILDYVRIRSDCILPQTTPADDFAAPILSKTERFYIVKWAKQSKRPAIRAGSALTPGL